MSLASRSIALSRPLLLFALAVAVLVCALVVGALLAALAGLPWAHAFFASAGPPQTQPCPGGYGGSC